MNQNIIYIIVFLTILSLMFYFFMIRPQRKKQKEHEGLVSQLRNGDRVITSGGIYGEVESVSQDSIVLRVESGASIMVTKSSITGRA